MKSAEESLNNIFGYGQTEESPGFLLWQVSNLWQRRIKRALDPMDLTHVQFMLLAGIYYLHSRGETVTQIRLAGHAGTDKMMTSNVVRTLEKKGLIVRQEHPTDSRAKMLEITQKGRELLKEAVPVVEETDRLFFDELGYMEDLFRNTLQELADQPLQDG